MLFVISTSQSFAQFKDGEATVMQGSTTTLHLTVSDNNVVVEGLEDGQSINIYSVNGELISSTRDTSFTLRHGAVYVIRIGKNSFKIAI